MDEVFTDSADVVEEVIDAAETSEVSSADPVLELVPSEAPASDGVFLLSDGVSGSAADSGDPASTPSPAPETSILTAAQTEGVSETGGGTDDVSETDDLQTEELQTEESQADDSQTAADLLAELQAQGEQLQAMTVQLQETNERLADIQGNRLQGIMNGFPVIVFLLGAVIGVLLVSVWASYLRP